MVVGRAFVAEAWHGDLAASRSVPSLLCPLLLVLCVFLYHLLLVPSTTSTLFCFFFVASRNLGSKRLLHYRKLYLLLPLSQIAAGMRLPNPRSTSGSRTGSCAAQQRGLLILRRSEEAGAAWCTLLAFRRCLQSAAQQARLSFVLRLLLVLKSAFMLQEPAPRAAFHLPHSTVRYTHTHVLRVSYALPCLVWFADTRLFSTTPPWPSRFWERRNVPH